MQYTIHPESRKILEEKSFEIFKHTSLYCCVQRIMYTGNLNGYVAVPETHSLYGKNYASKVIVKDIEEEVFNGNYMGLLCLHLDPTEAKANILPLSMAINVHCGLTYSDNFLCGIEDSVLGKLWWFGFDTAHSGDLMAFQNDLDRKYPHTSDTYKDFEFVKAETIKLAEQLSKY